VATGTTGEWDIFNMSTTNGGPLANNINGYWDITIDYVLSQAVCFDATALQWTVNGVPVSPLTNGIGSICCATPSNPILPGWAYYSSGFQGCRDSIGLERDIRAPVHLDREWRYRPEHGEWVHLCPAFHAADCHSRAGIGRDARRRTVGAGAFSAEEAKPELT